MSALVVGDHAPDFTAVAHTGERLGLRELCRRGIVVLYFYPKDATPGCTVQARAFRDVFDEFQAAGAAVIGVSHDSEESHRSFASNHRLPFWLVSDSDGSVRKTFGVPREFPRAVTSRSPTRGWSGPPRASAGATHCARGPWPTQARRRSR